jgi:hypothetical protein
VESGWPDLSDSFGLKEPDDRYQEVLEINVGPGVCCVILLGDEAFSIEIVFFCSRNGGEREVGKDVSG